MNSLYLSLRHFIRDNLKWHKTVALHEVFYYNNEVRLKKVRYIYEW